MKCLDHLTKQTVSQWGFAGILFLLAMLLSVPSSAHKLAPALLQLTETETEHYQIYWKIPAKLSGEGLLLPALPEYCVSSTVEWQRVATALEGRWQMDCSDGGLAEGILGVNRLEELRISVLVTIKRLDEEVLQVWLDEGNSRFQVPQRQDVDLIQTITDYLQYGIKHILTGWDHLVFLLLLLLLMSNALQLVYAVTAFTVGHSITLVLASVDLLVLNTLLVEMLIALSIVFLAVQLINKGSGWFGRSAAKLTLSFGLLHGLGFASVLQEVGLPRNDLLVALASFNVGIELGQLVFVFLLWQAMRYGRRHLPKMLALKSRVWMAYSLGSLAACWTIERTVLFLS